MILKHSVPDMSKLPGGWHPSNSIKLSNNSTVHKQRLIDDSVFILHDVLSQDDCTNLINFMNSSNNFTSVGIHGRNDTATCGVGSLRTTAWSEAISEELWSKIRNHTDQRDMNNYSSTDWWQLGKYRRWTPIGVSPLLRFMNYQTGGQHYAHYDAGYIYPDNRYRTLMSLVCYLTTNWDGGTTRFIHDGQSSLPIWERNHDDWIRPAESYEVIHATPPQRGSILVFDHRLCHDVECYLGSSPRIIIRADLIFKAI